MTRYCPSQALKRSPNSGILGGGNILPSWVPRTWREYFLSTERGWPCLGLPDQGPCLPEGPSEPGDLLSYRLCCLFFQYWAFSDIQTGRVLTKVTDETSGCCKLSPKCWALHSLYNVLFSYCSFVLKSTCCQELAECRA